jgi:hypothetical protein
VHAALVSLAQPRAQVTGTLGAMEWVFFELEISQTQYANDIDYFVEVNKTSTTTAFGYLDLCVSQHAPCVCAPSHMGVQVCGVQPLPRAGRL